MIELLGKLFELVVDKVPSVIAQTLFSIIAFPVHPYRTSLLLVRFARLNKVPTPLFVVIAFVIFMMLGGFAHPLFGNTTLDIGAMTKALSDLSNTDEHKTDVFFISLYALGLTSLVGFSHLCVEAARRGRYPQLFRDLHYVAMALHLPWFVAMFFLLAVIALLLALTSGFAALIIGSIGWVPLLIIVFGLSAGLMLRFGLQMDRRWYRSRPARRRLRVGGVYAATLAILALMPVYLYYLALTLYPDVVANNVIFKVDCFEDKSALFATVVAENPTADTKFLDGFQISLGSEKLVDVSRSVLFDGLKEDIALRPKDVRRFRLMFSSRDATPAFADHPVQSTCQVGHFYVPEGKAIKAEARILQ